MHRSRAPQRGAAHSAGALSTFDTFDFAAQPSLNKALVLELMRCEWIDRCQNCIALGPSGTGKTALGSGLAACQKGLQCRLHEPRAALVHELMEVRDERRLCALQKQLTTINLPTVDELGMRRLRQLAPNCSSSCPVSAMSVVPLSSPATCHSIKGHPFSVRNGLPVLCSTGSPIMSTSWRGMVKAIGVSSARRRSGDRHRGMAKAQEHQTKEILPPKCKSAQKNKITPGASQPFSLNPTGTLSRRHLAQFVSAVGIYSW